MVSITVFIPWFEEKLRDCLEIDLETIDYELQYFKLKVEELTKFSDDLRSIINSTASQIQNQKIVKYSENLSLLFSSQDMKVAILPDSEYINDLLQTYRIKLRSIDDMNTSGKNSRKDSIVDKTLYQIKLLVDTLLLTLDRLEYAHSKQLILTTYLYDIKINIFQPLIEQLNQFNAVSSKIASYNFHDSEVVIKEAIALHQSIGSADILQYVQLQHEEAQYIEVKIHDMLSPIREAIRSLGMNYDKYDDKEMNCYKVILSLFQVSEKEFFSLCRNKSTINKLRSAVGEVRSTILSSNNSNSNSNSESTSTSSTTTTTTMSTDNNINNNETTSNPSPSRSTKTTTTITTITTTDITIPSPERPLLSPSPPSSSSSEYPNRWDILVTDFHKIMELLDVELFLAYLEDWNLRIESIDRLTTTSEFIQKYNLLKQSRIQLQLAKESYEKMVEERLSDKYILNEVLVQLQVYSSTLKELCLQELKLDVQILLPKVDNDIFSRNPSTTSLNGSSYESTDSSSGEDFVVQ